MSGEIAPCGLEALHAVAFERLCKAYVQRADDRQRTMDLQYTTAETHDLAKFVARFALDAVRELERQP